MKKIILSIKPEYANKIFLGEKMFEYRKCIFRDKTVKNVIVYSTDPIRKIIGEFEIDSILHLDLGELWCNTKDYSGISEDFFMNYFKNKSFGYAIKIKNAKLYDKPKSIEEYGVKPPQTLVYIEEKPAF